MAFRDLRDYIAALEKEGEAIRIKDQVDWDLEAGAVVRLAQQLEAPAPIMENITDYPGQALAGGLYASYRRAAIAIGEDPDKSPAEVLDVYHRRLRHPIKPLIVDQAPCQENVVEGAEVNLFDFPAPMVHDGDGGRYLGTWQFVVTRDRDTDWINWGMYRQMIHNENTLGGLLMPQQDIGVQFYGKYVPNNEPMPFASVIGTEPLTSAVSAASYGRGRSEVDWAGGLRLEPVELVKCVSQPLYVPANAEIVIEGVVRPDETAKVYEGPFGEFTGYRSAPRMPRVAYHVTAITYRDNPITSLANMGVPVDDSHIVSAILGRSDILNVLETNGIPVVGCHVPPEMVSHVVVISVRNIFSGLANKVGSLIFGSKNTGGRVQIIIVCDEDVDVFDMGQVMHVISTKLHARRGISILDDQPSIPLMPALSYQERVWAKGPKMVWDCMWPVDWTPQRDIPVRSSFWDIYPQRVIQKVTDNWQKFGYPQDMAKVLRDSKEARR